MEAVLRAGFVELLRGEAVYGLDPTAAVAGDSVVVSVRKYH